MWCVVHRQTQLFIVNYKNEQLRLYFFVFVSKIKVYLFIEISFFQLPIIYVM